MLSPRRVVAMLLALACLAAPLFWAGQHREGLVRAAQDKALAELRAASERAEAELLKQAAALSATAASGADLPGLKAIVSQYATGDAQQAADETLRDVFIEERWWEPYRQKGTTLFFIGRRAVFTPDAQTAEAVAALVAEAETSAVSSRLVAVGPRSALAGAARVSVPTTQQDRGVVVLLAPPALEPVAKAVGGAVALVAAGTPTLSSGSSPLEAFLRTRAPDEACCAVRSLGPGLELAVERDPSALLTAADREAGRARLLALALGAALALAVLLAAFLPRRAAEAQEQLLRDTAAQLQQSQQALQRLTQELSRDGATPAGAAPADEGLARTAAPSRSGPRYQVVAPLGEGGMARVSIAVMQGSEGFRRHFVVKRMRPELAGTPELVNQFIDEARLGASLVHSNIVAVFDFGRDAEGYFLAQEYVIGRDVDALVQASLGARQRALEVPVVLYLAQEALKALAYAHTKADDSGRPMALVHRDVSPNNLMVSARGEVKLLDFGIVKTADRLTKTKTGVVKGNLFFMSPEQARGLEVDARSDLFSLGLVLLYAAQGATLYQGGSSYELMTRAGQGLNDEDRARVRSLPAPLPELLARALDTDPARRYPSADEFARAVASCGVAVATSAEVQRLMTTFFADELAAEQGRLSRGPAA